jgi:tetratricopeptide (TPR) repeat protein
MSAPVPTPFPPRDERDYDADAVERFPWPVVARYDEVHRAMDAGEPVYATWLLRDVWEALIKFLAGLAVADHLAVAPSDPRTSALLADLLSGGITVGGWIALLRKALTGGTLPDARFPRLGVLLFPRGKPGELMRLFGEGKTCFVSWRNRCIGHGVFRRSVASYADDACHWLAELHRAFNLCRDFFHGLSLESDGPNGELLTWGGQTPLPFYHEHQPPAAGALAPVRVRPAEGGEPVALSPLLTVQRCQTCGQWAAFTFDKYRRDNHKSSFLDILEGHDNEHKNLEPLRRWTELVSEADWQAAAGRAPDPDERREPDPERFRDFQHEFEPPVYLARQVADFLTGRDRGVLWLTGPGGVGKSWATLGLDHAAMLPAVLGRAVTELHVSMHGPTQPSAAEVWAALEERARRVKQWQVPPRPDGATPHARFAAWLAALMRANGQGELIVALDGLDDLPADSDVPDLWPPANELPPGCFLVLSSRPPVRAAAEAALGRVKGAAGHFREIPIGPTEPEHRAVLRQYVAKRLAQRRPDEQPPLPAAWAEPLIDRAEGSFLYVFHYCRALHFGVYADLSALPPPSAFYPAFFAHLRGRVGDRLFEDCYARTLALIAAAREPVGMTHLTAWGLERGRLIVVLDDLADLLRTRREPWDAETLYSLGHDAIRQFLSEDAAWQACIEGAHRFLAETAVQRFGADWDAVDPFDTVERYLLFHVLDHARDPALRERLLADAALADACLGHGNSLWEKRELEPALLAYGTAWRMREDQVGRQGRRELRNDLAAAYVNRGVTFRNLGRLGEALADYGAGIDLREQLVQREGRRELRNELARAYMNRGVALADLGRLGEALADHGAGIDLYETLVRREGRRELRNDHAAAYMNRGNALRNLGRLEEALADYGACIGLYEALVEREGRLELRNELAATYVNRGNALSLLGRLEEALADYGAGIGLYEALVQREGRCELRNGLADAYMNRGNALSLLGRLEEALADYGAGIDLREALVQREGRAELAGDLAWGYAVKADLLLTMAQPEKARHLATDAVQTLRTEVARTGRADLRRVLTLAEGVLHDAGG